MTESTTPTTIAGVLTPMPANKNRLILLLIALICLLPLLAALFFRFVSPPAIGKLAGVPLDPKPFAFAAIVRADGKPVVHPEVSDQWLVLVASSGACDKTCEDTLYLTRQARTAQGKNMSRVQRLWLVTDSVTPDKALLDQHPDLVVVKTVDSQALAAQISSTPAIHLIDRRGFLVFRYPVDTDPKTFIQELGKLVKF